MKQSYWNRIRIIFVTASCRTKADGPMDAASEGSMFQAYLNASESSSFDGLYRSQGQYTSKTRNEYYIVPYADPEQHHNKKYRRIDADTRNRHPYTKQNLESGRRDRRPVYDGDGLSQIPWHCG